MITTYSGDKGIRRIFNFIKEALSSKQQDFTKGSIRKAVFLLAIPMILEMCMESVFAVVDIFFVGKLGSVATANSWFNRISISNRIFSGIWRKYGSHRISSKTGRGKKL